MSPKPPAVPTEAVFRLSVDRYHRMAQAGILDEDDRVELLDGWLVAKPRQTPPHACCRRLAYDAIKSLLPPRFFVSSVGAVTLTTSEPEPDLIVVREERRDYVEHHPGAADVSLVVEVADDSLARDRTLKKAIYADAGIPAYWIVNLVDGCLEVFTEPSGPAGKPDYAKVQTLRPGEWAPVVVEGREVGRVAMQDILP